MPTLMNYDSSTPSHDYDSEDDKLRHLKKIRDHAKDLFMRSDASWKEVRSSALNDLRFFHGDQWDQALKSIGKIKKEPTINVNQLPTLVKNIENSLRQREITLTFSPSDELGSEDTAQVLNGLYRHIANESKASSQFIHAAGENGALVPGFGYLKVELDYEDDKPGEDFNDDQKILLKAIPDPFTIVPDYNAVLPDFSDANYWFEIHDYTVDDYKNEFPRSQLATASVDTIGIDLREWTFEKTVRVVEYWYKEEVQFVKYLLEDGSIVDSLRYVSPDNREDADASETSGRLPWPTNENGESKIFSRQKRCIEKKIKWMIFNGLEIIEQGEWLGDRFPYVAVTGPQAIIDGRRDIRGIIRFARDSQKMLNYFASSIARRIGSANKTPWILDPQSIKPYKNMWNTSNTENWAFLPYNSLRQEKDVNGVPLQNPMPQRADQMGQVTDLIQVVATFQDDLKYTMGVFDAGIGATPNDQSGIAIKTLAQQGQDSNFHFSDNLVRAVETLGVILADLIPKVYDKARVIRIVNPDSTEKIVRINEMFTKNGVSKHYDLTKGKYSVKVNAGPAYATRKQASLEQLLELARINPQVLPVIMKDIIGTMDFDGQPEVYDTAVKLFAQQFPNLVDNNEDGQPPLPPKAQAQMASMHQTIIKLTEELQTLSGEYEKAVMVNKTDVAKVGAQIQLENVKAKNQMDLEKYRAKADEKIAKIKEHGEMMDRKLDHIVDMHKLLLPHATKTENKELNKEEPKGKENNA